MSLTRVTVTGADDGIKVRTVLDRVAAFVSDADGTVAP